MPTVLVIFAVGVLVLGRSRECLSLTDQMPGSPGGQVCTTSIAPGAIVVAILLVASAVVVWAAQRRR